MKYVISFLLIILIGVNSYIGYNIINKSDSTFIKQAQCVGMYTSVKEYLNDNYKIDPKEDIGFYDYSTISYIDIWYSQKLNSCLVGFIEQEMDYTQTIGDEKYFSLTKKYLINDILNGYKSIYYCEYDGTGEKCDIEFTKKKGDLK